jgi:hypothetical protein
VIYDQSKRLGYSLAADISEDFKNIKVVGKENKKPSNPEQQR